MVQKSPGRTTYRTANGKSIDLDMLIQRNELTPAVGNARVNARGDELGQGGKIVRKREEILRDYYQNSPSVPDESARTKPVQPQTTEPTVDTPPVNKPTAKELAAFDDGYEEDEDGNFVKKG